MRKKDKMANLLLEQKRGKSKTEKSYSIKSNGCFKWSIQYEDGRSMTACRRTAFTQDVRILMVTIWQEAQRSLVKFMKWVCWWKQERGTFWEIFLKVWHSHVKYHAENDIDNRKEPPTHINTHIL